MKFISEEIEAKVREAVKTKASSQTAFCDEFPSSYESVSPLCALTVSTFTFTNFYRFEEQIISPDKYQDSENIIASSMQEIYNFVSENWDSEVWNLSDSSLPTLKD